MPFSLSVLCFSDAGTVNTGDVGPLSLSPSFGRLLPVQYLSRPLRAESPINSRHRGYSKSAAKVCGARGAVNKRAISLREIMLTHLSKHPRREYLALHPQMRDEGTRLSCLSICRAEKYR